MTSCAETELDAGHLEQVAPHMTGEDWIPVDDDGCQETMEPNNAVEEGAGDRRSHVWMTQADEVRILKEAVHHGEDD